MPRILFDQNVPTALGKLLSGYEVRTAAEQGWGELENCDLLRIAEHAGFSVLVTADRNIVYQQNLKDRTIGLIVLSTNHWQTIRANVDRILEAVQKLVDGGYAYVECEALPGQAH